MTVYLKWGGEPYSGQGAVAALVGPRPLTPSEEFFAAEIIDAPTTDALNDYVLAASQPKNLRQILRAEPFFGFDNGLEDTQIYPSAARAPQGMTRVTLAGTDYYFILQTDAGTAYETDETKRWVCFEVGDGDGGSLTNAGYSDSLHLGHQGAGSFVENGVIYLISAMTIEAGHTGTDSCKGFSVTRWRPGIEQTTDADVVNYQMFGYSGSGHRFARYYGATGFNSTDNKYWFLVTASEDDTNSRWCFVYESAAIIAADDPLDVDPIAQWPLVVDSAERIHVFHDGCADANTITLLRGHTGPFSRHRVEKYNYAGRRIDHYDPDTYRSIYGRDALLDHPTLGIPLAIEPEGVCLNGRETETLVSDVWHSPVDIVSWGGFNWACIVNGTLNRLPTLQLYWVKTEKAANRGAWDAATTYNATTSGNYTRREKGIWGVKPTTGEEGERGLDSGIVYAPTGATISTGESAVDFSFVYGRYLQFFAFAEANQTYYNSLVYTGQTLRLFDHSADTSDNEKYGRVGVQFGSDREFSFLSSVSTAEGGAQLTVYGLNDSLYPGGYRLFVSTAVECQSGDINGQTLFTAASGYTPVTAKRADSGNMFNASRGSTVYFSAYVSTTNAQIIARNGVNLAFATASTSDPAQTSTIRWRIPGASAGSDIIGDFLPHIDNTYNLGGASNRVKVLFAGTATINTSDERLKRDIEAVRDDLLDAWGAIDWCAYRWKDSYEEKGDGARWHFGLIAQRVVAAIDGAMGAGSAIRMGIACYDEWEATPEIRDDVMETHVVGWTITGWELSDPSDPNSEPIPRKEAITEDRPTGETIVVQEARPAGNRWGLRYEECFAIEAAWTRRELAQLGGAARG